MSEEQRQQDDIDSASRSQEDQRRREEIQRQRDEAAKDMEKEVQRLRMYIATGSWR